QTYLPTANWSLCPTQLIALMTTVNCVLVWIPSPFTHFQTTSFASLSKTCCSVCARAKSARRGSSEKGSTADQNASRRSIVPSRSTSNITRSIRKSVTTRRQCARGESKRNARNRETSTRNREGEHERTQKTSWRIRNWFR